MRYIKLGMKLGLTAYAAVSTYAFLKTLDKMIAKKIDKKLTKAMEEAEDAEKKEQAAEDFEDFLR